MYLVISYIQISPLWLYIEYYKTCDNLHESSTCNRMKTKHTVQSETFHDKSL